MCMSLVNKSEVGAGLKKCANKLVWCVYEFGKQIRVRAGLRKKCASKLVCDLCISLVNKSEVGAGLKKSVRVS